MKKIPILCLACLLAVPAVAKEVGHQVVPGSIDLAARAADMDLLSQRLLANEDGLAPVARAIELPASEVARLAAAPADEGRLLVGAGQDVGLTVATAARDFGDLRFTADGSFWVGALRSPGATAVRAQLTGFRLPKGAEMYVYNDRGDAFGPYVGSGPAGDGVQWTHTVLGDEIRFQVHFAGQAPTQRAPLFTVRQLAHLGDSFLFAQTQNVTKAFCSFNEACTENAACSNIPSAIQPAADATAHLLFAVGNSYYICSGGLLNDTDGATTIPYLLTANHCFSTSNSASSLEAYFDFTTSCNGSCYNPYSSSLPRTVGSTILSTSSSSDYTLVRLSQSPPAGSVLLGWNTSPVANSAGTGLYRISHPGGAPQAYSTHSVNTTAGTCSSWPRGNWIYSDDTYGATEGGSSGSVVLNASGQVVGQLSGACGFSPTTSCDGDDRTVDGALAAYFGSVAQWLDPGSGPSCSQAGAACSSNSDCCSNKCRGRRGNKTCR